jgi:hypothetical protein
MSITTLVHSLHHCLNISDQQLLMLSLLHFGQKVYYYIYMYLRMGGTALNVFMP